MSFNPNHLIHLWITCLQIEDFMIKLNQNTYPINTINIQLIKQAVTLQYIHLTTVLSQKSSNSSNLFKNS